MLGDRHVSRWPKYFRKKPRERVLSYEVDNIVTTEEGVVYEIKSYDEYKLILVSGHLDNYTASFKYLEQALEDKKANVWCDRHGNIRKVDFKYDGYGNQQGSVCFSSSWGHRQPSSMFIKALRRLFNEYGAGTCATPGALGNDRFSQFLRDNGRLQFSRPSLPFRNKILSHRAGGRADACRSPNIVRRVVYSEDANSYYTFNSLESINLSETPAHFIREPGNCFTYYSRCIVTIPEEVNIDRGPLAVRDTHGLLQFPTMTGMTWESWYWKEEVEQARSVGYDVQTFEGWRYQNSSNVMSEWALFTYDMLLMFKKLSSEGDLEAKMCADMSKRILNSTIGRLGMAPTKVTIVSWSDKKKGDKPILDKSDDSPVTGWFCHEEYDKDSNALTQLNEYIVMKGRVMLYERMVQNIAAGNKVLATNYDCIYLLNPNTLESSNTELGGWKVKVLHNWRSPAMRTFVSDEYMSLPGIKENRQELFVANLQTSEYAL